MTASDQDHFKLYTEQNRVKHAILSKYFGAYTRALARVVNAFHYIDGFAGPGRYQGTHPGSPLLVLQLLSQQKRPFAASLVENDPALHAQLASEVNQHPTVDHQVEQPYVLRGRFEDFISEILARPIYRRYQRVATFAFVDPCGVTGVRMSDLVRLLSLPYGECLLFWNYDGINRWLGGILAGSHDRASLAELLGSVDNVEEALRIFQTGGLHKELQLRDLFIKVLKNHSGARYILPFRVENRLADRTSHYLIHCSNDGLAFKIMKDVMGTESSGQEGEFALLSTAETGSLFAPHLDRARGSMLRGLTVGSRPVRVRFFTEDWVRRPEDFLRSKDYKHLLLEMEREGTIEVLDKTGTRPAPADRRRKVKGRPTLGDDYFVRRRP